ncbi:probable YJU3 Serine protease, localizes to lipid particles [Phialocephala subalpina]|uniref:Probable YJU3 Serine protease, localizes to lipid particles n=1 Tax=Phialocephala subalpina TaxID=576137 RepID=A0A1L7XV95_9HELO|nr:probable YJU3 Serine protease, localizes to lipid particles [Phialocephala subalpina]
MPTEIEGTHQIGDMTLYTKSWKPDGPAVAKLIFIHGFSDHMNRYYELFPTLASRGIEIHGFDQRGWGRSVHNKSQIGDTGPTSLVISDIVSFIKTQLPSNIPVFVMGHSMGGGEAIILASDPQYADLTKEIRGWLLEAPFIAFPKGFEPSSVTVFFGRLAGKLLPHMKRYSPLPPENLTRDPEVVQSLKDDKLCHDTGTLEGLSGLLDRTEQLNKGIAKLNPGIKSIWLGHGTEDKGTSYEEAKKWLDRQTQVEDKEFKSYEGWYHQLHADLPQDRPVFAKDVGDWILARVDDSAVKSKL